MVGGSTRIPKLRSSISEFFDKKVAHDVMSILFLKMEICRSFVTQ